MGENLKIFAKKLLTFTIEPVTIYTLSTTDLEITKMAKTVNYTPEMETVMSRMYNSVREESESCRDDMVKLIAEELQKNERSVRAKLSRMQIYVPKTAVSKVTGDTPAKKLELATQLVAVAGVKADPENVAKMNKLEIMAFLTRFIELAPESQD
jgi:hypothetical protein